MRRIFNTLFVSILVLGLLVPSLAQAADTFMPYKKTFITTGYYSPLPDQEHYVTGSYYGDTRLNGNGTNGASGAEVFPGMLAAPKSYPFGFKIDIPGVGISEVQDRGGAIVSEGERGNTHDRLDVWFGAGETGLRRALIWGKRTVMATVYGVRPELALTASFDDWDGDELELVRYWKEHAPQYVGSMVATLFPRDLWFGEESEKVEELQQLLADLGYFIDNVDGNYDDATARAIYHFQRDNDIIYDWSELGAGHLGPHTRVTIEKAKELLEKGEYVNQTAYLEEIQVHEDLKEEFMAFTDELYLGVNNDAVRELQQELIALGYLRTDATGNYGEVTENAVKRFQMKVGVVSSAGSHGAGVVGPQTRAALNGIFDKRIEAKGMIAMKRDVALPSGGDVDGAILLASTEDVVEIPEEEVIEEELEEQITEEIVEKEIVVEVESEQEPEPVTLVHGSRGLEVKELQRALRDMGHFNSGFLTTYFGEKTQSALIEFQMENGLISNADDEIAGMLDSGTRELLF
ncbi:hypothetical protein HOG48_02220 [Candidatus Peregrinibacteria bacterium]|jgi:peptidoglycan hydrolase-like protein with peptidoglycan-binding domain|nr:hypothetical protein [Candidatus Peregrinibacteria bacterium]